MDLAAAIAWLIFLGVWLVLAFRTKRTAQRIEPVKVMLHVLILTVAIALLVAPPLRVGLLGTQVLPDEHGVEDVGYAMQMAGVALSIWARLYLGTNWSNMPVLKEGHQLVRGGPYAAVRHPIYTGLLLALLGLAVQHGKLAGFLGAAILVVEWKRKSLMEERLMVQQFGAEYERYRREVKGLVPWVW